MNEETNRRLIDILDLTKVSDDLKKALNPTIVAFDSASGEENPLIAISTNLNVNASKINVLIKALTYDGDVCDFTGYLLKENNSYTAYGQNKGVAVIEKIGVDLNGIKIVCQSDSEFLQVSAEIFDPDDDEKGNNKNRATEINKVSGYQLNNCDFANDDPAEIPLFKLIKYGADSADVTTITKEESDDDDYIDTIYKSEVANTLNNLTVTLTGDAEGTADLSYDNDTNTVEINVTIDKESIAAELDIPVASTTVLGGFLVYNGDEFTVDGQTVTAVKMGGTDDKFAYVPKVTVDQELHRFKTMEEATTYITTHPDCKIIQYIGNNTQDYTFGYFYMYAPTKFTVTSSSATWYELSDGADHGFKAAEYNKSKDFGIIDGSVTFTLNDTVTTFNDNTLFTITQNTQTNYFTDSITLGEIKDNFGYDIKPAHITYNSGTNYTLTLTLVTFGNSVWRRKNVQPTFMMDSLLRYRGVITAAEGQSDTEALTTQVPHPQEHDVYTVMPSGQEYFWDGGEWEYMGQVLDIPEYTGSNHISVDNYVISDSGLQDELTAGDGIDIDESDDDETIISVKYDNNTIKLNDAGKLYVDGELIDTTYLFELPTGSNLLKMGTNNGAKTVIYEPVLTKGDNGKDGTKWITGILISGDNDVYDVTISGAVKGDFYLNISSFNVYQLSENTQTSTLFWNYLGKIKGDDGQDGNTPVITVDSSKSGDTTTIQFKSDGVNTGNPIIIKDGSNGQDGLDGSDGSAATITVGTVTSGSTASVTNSGTSSAAVFDFVLPKGDTGDSPIVSATATVDNNSSNTPTVTVTKSGTDAAPSFAFAFSGLKGAPGSGAGTVTSITATKGVVTSDGDPITSSGTIKASLKGYTPNQESSTREQSGSLYAVELDGDDVLAVTIPSATDGKRGLIKLGNGDTQTITVNNPTAITGRTYPVLVNSSGLAVVNVPTGVPTVKNELIYSDNNATLTTHELMFTRGLVVDNAYDLDLCKRLADIAMSTIIKPIAEGGWISYGSGDSGDDKKRWGYCDSTGNNNTQYVYLVGAEDAQDREDWKELVPVFKYNGKSQDYIFNTKNTNSNTGYYNSEPLSEFDSIITCGILPSMQYGELQDYMAIVPALTLSNEKGLTNGFNYGISIHVENEEIDGGSSTIDGRPRYISGGSNLNKSTIIITAWKQNSLNSTTSGETNINILDASNGMDILPFVSELNNGNDSHNIKTSCIQTRTIRKENTITFYVSDPYPVLKSHYDENGETDNKWIMEVEYDSDSSSPTYGLFIPKVEGGKLYNDDYDFRNTIHYERPVVIDLDAYTVTYIDENGNNHTNDFSTTGSSSNADVRKIFMMLRDSAHRGFECESNPGTFFRNCSSPERIIDVTIGEDKVYDYDGYRWNRSYKYGPEWPTTAYPYIKTEASSSVERILQSTKDSGAAPYVWGTGSDTRYTKHPVPTTSEFAYRTSAAEETGKEAITNVGGTYLLSQDLFKNGSRIAWNHITDKLFYNDGSKIYRVSAAPKEENTIPVGTIQMYAGSTAPSGWLLCEGQSILLSTASVTGVDLKDAKYDNLYRVLSTPTGTYSVKHLPDLRGRFPLGYGTSTDTGISARTTMGAEGGYETVTLTAAQSGLPSHTHTITLNQTSSAGAGDHALVKSTGVGTEAYTTDVMTSGEDASSSHTNMPPYCVINFIIKY